jgi:hypothetical protein
VRREKEEEREKDRREEGDLAEEDSDLGYAIRRSDY